MEKEQDELSRLVRLESHGFAKDILQVARLARSQKCYQNLISRCGFLSEVNVFSKGIFQNWTRVVSQLIAAKQLPQRPEGSPIEFHDTFNKSENHEFNF